MSFDLIRSGSLIRYPYLWAREADRGETAGRKTRPVVVALRLARSDGDALVLLAITTRSPEQSRRSIEIPKAEKCRCGLDEDRRLWIILDEYNRDIVGDSFYLLPEEPLGSFGKPFFVKLLKVFYAGRSEARDISRRGE